MPRKPADEARPRMIDTQKRVVVPPEVLAALDAKPGDYVAFRIEGKNVSVHKARWSIDR